MFYSNVLSVRRILLEIKKEVQSMGLLRRREKCPGEVMVLEKGQNQGARKKESARGRCLVSCSGTLLLLDDDVVDKLFGF